MEGCGDEVVAQHAVDVSLELLVLDGSGCVRVPLKLVIEGHLTAVTAVSCSSPQQQLHFPAGKQQAGTQGHSDERRGVGGGGPACRTCLHACTGCTL